jgi:hypothetical protein
MIRVYTNMFGSYIAMFYIKTLGYQFTMQSMMMIIILAGILGALKDIFKLLDTDFEKVDDASNTIAPK